MPHWLRVLESHRLVVGQRLQIGVTFGIRVSVGPGDEFIGVSLHPHSDATVLASDQAIAGQLLESIAVKQSGFVGLGREEEQFAINERTRFTSDHQWRDSNEVRQPGRLNMIVGSGQATMIAFASTKRAKNE